VSNLQLRLPVLEAPGSGGGIVQEPAPVVVPPGYEPAIDYRGSGGTGNKGPAPVAKGVAGLARGRIRATRDALLLKLRCAGAAPCAGSLSIRVGKRALASGSYSIAAGQVRKVRLPLSKTGRKFVARRRISGSPKKTFAAKLSFADSGRSAPFDLTRPVHLGRG
jgi:hypothetical protein